MRLIIFSCLLLFALTFLSSCAVKDNNKDIERNVKVFYYGSPDYDEKGMFTLPLHDGNLMTFGNRRPHSVVETERKAREDGVCYSEDVGFQVSEFIALKTDRDGKLLSERIFKFFSTSFDSLSGTLMPDSTIWVLIRSTASAQSFYDDSSIRLLHVSQNGDSLGFWSYDLPGPKTGHGIKITSTKDNHLILAGISRDEEEYFEREMYLMKLDAQGEMSWIRIMNNIVESERPMSVLKILETNDGNYAIIYRDGAGFFMPSHYLVKIDSDGNFLSKNKLSHFEFSLCELENGQFLAIAQRGISFTKQKLLKYDTDGDLIWKRRISQKNRCFPFGIIPWIDKNYLIGGYTILNKGGSYDKSKGEWFTYNFIEVDDDGKMLTSINGEEDLVVVNSTDLIDKGFAVSTGYGPKESLINQYNLEKTLSWEDLVYSETDICIVHYRN